MTGLTKRSFLGSAALVAASCASATRAPFFASRNLPLGIQLYTLGEMVREDFAGAMRAISKIGYQSVQLAGFHGHTPAQILAALEAAGLDCPSAHIAPQLRAGEPSLNGDVGRLAEDLRRIGVRQVITPVFLVPDRIDGATRTDETRGQALARVARQLEPDDWRRNADFLNKKGIALRREGLGIGYHNHNAEFAPFPDGETGLSLLMANTDPDIVSFELDAGWAVMAGAQPEYLLSRFPARITHVHVKDVRADTQPNFEFRQSSVEIGSGVLDWSTLLPAFFAAGVRTFTVEQDPPFTRSRLEAVSLSFDFLSSIRV
jgi:sugar phosphate isomerase/epimerase